MLRIKANQLPALAQTSANILCPGRELTGVTMGQLAQTIKFRRYSLSAPRVRPRACAKIGLSGFSSNCFRKIEARATLAPWPDQSTMREQCGAETRRLSARQKYITSMSSNQAIRKKEKMPWGVVATRWKGSFRTRKSKTIQAFSFDFLCSAWLGFAGFC
jgi:hypothetical protein